MSSLESFPEQHERAVQPSVLRKLGGLTLFTATCAGMAANMYVIAKDLPDVPRIGLSIIGGLLPFGALKPEES